MFCFLFVFCLFVLFCFAQKCASSKHTFQSLFLWAVSFFIVRRDLILFFLPPSMSNTHWVVYLSCTVPGSSDQRVTVAGLTIPNNVWMDYWHSQQAGIFWRILFTSKAHSQWEAGSLLFALLIDILRGGVNNSVDVSTVQRDGGPLPSQHSSMKWMKYDSCADRLFARS